MAKVKELTVQLDNRPGTLARLLKVLADGRVNLLAFLGTAARAQGSVQVVVDNVIRAKKALGEAGFQYTEGRLEEFELANSPGALAQLAGKLAKKGINIDCIYATVHKRAKKAAVVLSTSRVGDVPSVEAELDETDDNALEEKDGYAEGPVG
ncbi:MAG TPA: hypothetical protein VMP68_05800 [Candidatus Eisenbacteria bacterium]|nr:hypothetical protein [Candidatus Eisenbacteria bacterium]